MSNIGATNSSNIDAQLAAKRAEEERKKAEAAKLEAEQKAKAEAQKAQADAKSAAAQKGKDAQSTKTKAEDVSIHTAQKTDITATQTSAAKASVHTQVAETKTKETTPQETKSSSTNSATKKVDYEESLSRAITGGKWTSLFDNQFSTETTSGDTVNLSSSGQTSLSSMNASYEIGLTGNIQNLSDNTKDLTIQVLDPNSKANKLVMLSSMESSMDSSSGRLTLVALNLDTVKKCAKELGFKNLDFDDYKDVNVFKQWVSDVSKRKKSDTGDFIKNTREYCAKRLADATSDADKFDKIFGKKPVFLGKFLENFNLQGSMLQVAFLHWASRHSDKLCSNANLTKKLEEVLTSKDTDPEVKAAALYSIARNEKLSKEDKDKFFKKLDAEKVKKVIVDQIRSKCLTEEDAERVIADLNNALNEFSKCEGSGAQTGADFCAAGAGAGCQNEKHVHALHNSGDNNEVRSKALGQAVPYYKEDLQTKAVECAMELPQEGRQAAISRLHELDKENQVPATRIVSRHEMTTEDDRILLSSQIPKFDENVQTEASRVFLAEKRNTESARVMTAFTEQIPNLGISIEQKTAIYNQVNALGNVSPEIMASTKNQLATQYYELTNRTDFDNFANTINQNSANTNIVSTTSIPTVNSNVANSRTTTLSNSTKTENLFGLFGIAKSIATEIKEALSRYGVFNGIKPTMSQFIDMLDKEILSAETVVKAGYKDILIQQFSALNSDAQIAVLETLTDEEKIMMRQKGLLPKRFWEQVEKTVAAKALKGGEVSSTDANLLARTASNSVLYQCLNDSSIRLSAQSKSLFRKTLIDNNYIRKNINGEYEKAK